LFNILVLRIGEYANCRNRNRDGTTNQKLKICKNRVWSRHHSYYRKLWKIIKKSKVCKKPEFGSGSRLRVGKVLAPHNARPKTVPLIKCAKKFWFFLQYLIFPKNINKRMYKKQNYFFDFLDPTRINPRSYVSPCEWRIRVT